jgi:putative PIN family toxin of toxin-antitoxin system
MHAAASPSVVIDTQIVMDWMVFGDVSVQPLVERIETGSLRWIGRPAMLEELRQVLGRGVAARYQPDLASIEARFSVHCEQIEFEPAPAIRLVCRDRDDQMFIDLAIATQARWLFSRDRAVLALSKRARAFGLEIVTPLAWSRQQAQLAQTAAAN